MDQAESNVPNMLQLGIRAAQAKHKTEAYQLLSEVVQRDPQNEQGWLWLAAVAPDAQESLAAFGRVLEINPQNEQARVGRRWATARLVKPATPAAAQSPAGAPRLAAEPVPAPPLDPEPSSESAMAAQQSPAAPSPAPAGTAFSAPRRVRTAPLGPAPDLPDAPPPPPTITYAPAGSRETAPAAGAPGSLAVAEAPAGAESSAVAAPAPGDWRAAGDLAVSAPGLDWDDDGAGLHAHHEPSAAPHGVVCPNCGAPGQTGLHCSLCDTLLSQPGEETALDPALRGVHFAPASPHPAPAPPLDETQHVQDYGAPVAVAAPPVPREEASVLAPYGEPLRPVPRPANPMVLVLGGLLLLVGLLVSANGLFGGANSGYDAAARQFFQAQLAGKPTEAASFLTGKLQNDYMAAHDLPDVHLQATLAGLTTPSVQSAPLAKSDDDTQGEALVTVAPAAGPPVRYTAHLVHVQGRWLVDAITPYSATP